MAATNLLKVGETTHWGGGALEYMVSQRCTIDFSLFEHWHSYLLQTLSSKVGEQGGMYYTSPPGSSKYGEDAFGREFKVSQVSKEARASDDGKAKRFWELSEKLVGV